MSSDKYVIPRAYSYTDIERKEFRLMPFEGEWKRHFGTPERSGSILIYGDSGHGKTAYALQLLKYLTHFERVHYNSSEEGMKQSFKLNMQLNGLKSVSSKYAFHSELYDDLILRLNRKRQPKVVVIDSVQYCFRGKQPKHYFELINMFPDTLFVFVSQIRKGEPKGAIAEDIKWDAQNVIRVQDFRAYIEKSRCGGDELSPYIVSKYKAEQREMKLLKKG